MQEQGKKVPGRGRTTGVPSAGALALYCSPSPAPPSGGARARSPGRRPQPARRRSSRRFSKAGGAACSGEGSVASPRSAQPAGARHGAAPEAGGLRSG